MTRYIIMVFTGACCFGILSTFVKVAYQEGYTTGDISGSQACFGMMVLWILYLLQQKTKASGIERPHTASWKVILAGTSIGLCTHLYYLSVQWIPASVAIIFLMQFTWIGLLLEWLIYGKRPSLLQCISALLIMFGTIIPPLLFSAGIPKTGVILSALLMTVELPVAVITARLVLHEHISFLQWNGVLLMLLAMALPPLQQLAARRR